MTATTSRSRGAISTWPTLLGLAILWAFALLGQTWVFALLFLGWAVSDVMAGESWFLQRISRRQHPATFWAVVGTWIAMAVLWLAFGT